MKLTLERYKFAERYTYGRLYLDGGLFCYTLEDKVREVEGESVAQWKIPGETAIPRGVYSLGFHESPHFGKTVPWLHDVPGYEYVLIHWGNTDKQTEGCILVGGIPIGDDFLPNSRATWEHLWAQIEAAEERGESISIEVK